MPWRLGPQAALALGVPGALALVAVSGVFRAPPAVPASPVVGDDPAGSRSIDSTLARDDEGCAGVRTTVWHPLSGLDYTGRLRITLPPRPGGAIVLYVGDTLPLDLEAFTDAGEPVPMERERLSFGPGVHVPPDYWLDDGNPLRAPPEITRVVIEAESGRVLPVTLLLGRRAPRVIARLAGYPPDARVAVCAAPVRAGEVGYATGWYGEEPGPEGLVRWMREHGAVLVGTASGGPVHVRLRAAPAMPSSEGRPATVRLRVNDVLDTAALPMRDGFADYEWDIPASAWVAGTNELLITVSTSTRRGTRRVGLALASLHVQ